MAYHRSCSVEIRLWRAVGLRIDCHPILFQVGMPLGNFEWCVSKLCGTFFLGNLSASVSASAIFAATIECIRRGGVIGVRGFRINPRVDVGSS